MTIKELIATLQTRNLNAQVYFMTQRKQPFENHIAGVVGREEMADQAWRIEPGVARDDVFLVTGRRIRPGSLSAWIIAEHQPARLETCPRLSKDVLPNSRAAKMTRPAECRPLTPAPTAARCRPARSRSSSATPS